MKILALVGSPRKGGNTDILIDCILKGSEASGHTTSKVYLYDHQISPCIDCRRCKKDDNTCPLKDGMTEIYPIIEEADLIIFGTPIYWYGPTGMMKLLIDRMRPFIASRKLNGKKGLVVSPSEEGPACCGPMNEMFLMSFRYLGMESAGSLLARAYEKGEIRKSPEYLEQAYDLGRAL
jgi:multimeric flavodoxin WrbA